MSLYIRNLKSLTNEAHRNTEKTLVPLYIKHYLIGNKALIMLNFYQDYIGVNNSIINMFIVRIEDIYKKLVNSSQMFENVEKT